MQACRRTSVAKHGPAKGDVKLLFVPFIFLLLRIWTSVTDVGLSYINPMQQVIFRCSDVAAALAVLSVSVNPLDFPVGLSVIMFIRSDASAAAKSDVFLFRV